MTAPPTISAEQARGLPMPLHHVTWTIAAVCGVRGEFSCDAAPPMSACRLVCAEDCGAEQWPCGGGEDEYHRMRDGGECHVLLFLTESGAEDSYDPGAPTAPVRSGAVEVCWQGGMDEYVWSYATAPPLSPAEQAVVDRFEAAPDPYTDPCPCCAGRGGVTARAVPVCDCCPPVLVPCPLCGGLGIRQPDGAA